jgi:two-component system KDP operon response regulator KdpE
VLVVEDEGLIRWAVRQALTGEGHTVIEAGDAASARRLIEEAREPFDVMLLDIQLPDSNDFTLLRDLRRLSPTSAVVMMTAHAEAVLTAGALGLGARCVIDKPFDLGSLTNLVRELAPVVA